MPLLKRVAPSSCFFVISIYLSSLTSVFHYHYSFPRQPPLCRPGDRILAINGVDCRNFPHTAVVRMVRDAVPHDDQGDAATLTLVVMGPNHVIRNSLRQKKAKLRLSSATPAVIQLGVRGDYVAASPEVQHMSASTNVTWSSPGGIAESELGSMPDDVLTAFVFEFCAEFEVSTWPLCPFVT